LPRDHVRHQRSARRRRPFAAVCHSDDRTHVDQTVVGIARRPCAFWSFDSWPPASQHLVTGSLFVTRGPSGVVMAPDRAGRMRSAIEKCYSQRQRFARRPAVARTTSVAEA
jgi:hypothetical protein